MSGCYDYNECGYQPRWDCDDYCYRPRRCHRRRYEECWSYTSYCN